MPQLIYCDQNSLIHLFNEINQSDSSKREVVLDDLQLVLSPWHWVEIARDKNKSRLLELAAFTEALHPLYLPERWALRQEEVHEELCRFSGLESGRPRPVRRLQQVAEAILGVHGIRNLTAIDLADGINQRFDPIMEAHRKNYEDRKVNLQSAESGQLTSEVLDRVFRLTVRQVIPPHTPGGMALMARTVDDFVSQVRIDQIPTIALEHALFQDEINCGSRLNFQSFSDNQHAIVALPYVDVFATGDAGLRNRIDRIRRVLRFPLAGIISREELAAQIIR